MGLGKLKRTLENLAGKIVEQDRNDRVFQKGIKFGAMLGPNTPIGYCVKCKKWYNLEEHMSLYCWEHGMMFTDRHRTTFKIPVDSRAGLNYQKSERV